MTCPYCGESVSDNSDECPHCQFNLWKYKYVFHTDAERAEFVEKCREKQRKKEDAQRQVKCPACGAEMKKKDKQCKKCWFDVEQYESKSEEERKDFLETFIRNRRAIEEEKAHELEEELAEEKRREELRVAEEKRKGEMRVAEESEAHFSASSVIGVVGGGLLGGQTDKSVRGFLLGAEAGLLHCVGALGCLPTIVLLILILAIVEFILKH